MNTMRVIATIISIFFVVQNTNANAIDSIQQLLNQETIDTNGVNRLISLAQEIHKSNPDKALLLAKEAQSVSDTLKFYKGKAYALEILGYISMRRNMFDSAIVEFKSALYNYTKLAGEPELSSQQIASKGKADCLFKIGNANYYKGLYDTAIHYYAKAKIEYKSAGNDESVAKMLKNSGACYQLLGNYTKSLECYHQALQISEQLNAKFQIADCYNNIGVINSEQNNYEKALEYFNLSLKICNEENFKDCMAYAYSNIGNVHFKKNEFNKALLFYQKTLNVYLALDNKRQIAASYANIANTYTSMEKHEDAIVYFKKAIDISEALSDMFSLTYIFNNMATLYNSKGDYNTSISYAKKTIALAKESGMLQLEETAYKNLSNSYEMLNNSPKALEFYKLFTEMKDSIFNIEKHKQIAELQTKYETEKTERQKVIAEKEKEIFVLKYNKQKTWTTSLIIGILGILVFSIIVFRQRNKQKNSNKILVRKNKEVLESEKYLQEQRDELERIIEIMQQQNIRQEVIEETKKYAQSKLQVNDQQQIMHKIEHLMQKKKLFLQSDLTLEKLAKKMNTNRSYISQVINDNYNQNFSNFLNEQRIKEACSLLADPNNQHLSIEGIAQNVGFNSIATFNRCFKKFTGVTPSLYIKNIIIK